MVRRCGYHPRWVIEHLKMESTNGRLPQHRRLVHVESTGKPDEGSSLIVLFDQTSRFQHRSSDVRLRR